MNAEIDAAVLLWTKAGAIGQIVGAVATAGAVFVSLWIVLSERRERLALNVGHRLITSVDPTEDWIEICSFDVVNTGQRPVRIDNVGWRIGWFRRGPNWLRYSYAIQLTNEWGIGSSAMPYTLGISDRTFFNIRMAKFGEPTPAVEDLFSPRRLPFGFMVFPPFVGQVSTARGTVVTAKVERNLRNKIIEYSRLSSNKTGN